MPRSGLYFPNEPQTVPTLTRCRVLAVSGHDAERPMRARKIAVWLGCERQRGARASRKQHAWLFMDRKAQRSFRLERWALVHASFSTLAGLPLQVGPVARRRALLHLLRDVFCLPGRHRRSAPAARSC